MLHDLYDWAIQLAAAPHAVWALAAIAFIESSVFPLPPDLLLIPMVLASPEDAWWLATVAPGWPAILSAEADLLITASPPIMILLSSKWLTPPAYSCSKAQRSTP